MNQDKKLPDHIEEYFNNKQQPKEVVISDKLFTATKEDIDLKTDLKPMEIVYINVLHFNNSFLVNAKLEPVFEDFIGKYMRLKVSQDRKSRIEYVDINKKDRFEEHMNKFANFKTIGDAKAT